MKQKTAKVLVDRALQDIAIVLNILEFETLPSVTALDEDEQYDKTFALTKAAEHCLNLRLEMEGITWLTGTT